MAACIEGARSFLIVADPLGGKRLLDLGVYIGAQDEVILMADEGP